ncbi:hypothetical protein NLI96_g4830 [Meripilus lineatus]|uniref:Uncharacterized protein n=1 Tax=Meripilus lineatus TaxID=2056292 RepID=A0AAD5V908_9APHY|nr:hypothetical protein NLI96_g4830 [Physisporinus lineatus]
MSTGPPRSFIEALALLDPRLGIQQVPWAPTPAIVPNDTGHPTTVLAAPKAPTPAISRRGSSLLKFTSPKASSSSLTPQSPHENWSPHQCLRHLLAAQRSQQSHLGRPLFESSSPIPHNLPF